MGRTISGNDIVTLLVVMGYKKTGMKTGDAEWWKSDDEERPLNILVNENECLMTDSDNRQAIIQLYNQNVSYREQLIVSFDYMMDKFWKERGDGNK